MKKTTSRRDDDQDPEDLSALAIVELYDRSSDLFDRFERSAPLSPERALIRAKYKDIYSEIQRRLNAKPLIINPATLGKH